MHVHATAGGPTGAQLFNQVSVAFETACLLASSYTCGRCSPSPIWECTGPNRPITCWCLRCGVLIVTLVIGGSLWMMANLNENMMPSAKLINLHMQR